MPAKRKSPSLLPSDACFVKELAGEAPPSFGAMQRLYDLATELFRLQPWRVLDESQLIAVRDNASGELCYCSVMGALGEVYAMHAYIGDKGLRAFRKLEAEALTEPGEFFAIMHAVSVEFVLPSELDKQDRELLAALRHPTGRGVAAPIFRSMRPGFYPWFVTAQEAETLAECMRAVIVVCSAVAVQTNAKFWDRADTYPIVRRVESAEPQYEIALIESCLPPLPPIPSACLDEKSLEILRGRDHAMHGTMELDYVFSATPIGKKNERKMSSALVLALDADTGFVLAAEATSTNVASGDALARAFLKAVQSSRTFPKEVRVRRQELKDSLDPLMRSLGISLRVTKRLPASDKAREHLLGFLCGPANA